MGTARIETNKKEVIGCDITNPANGTQGDPAAGVL